MTTAEDFVRFAPIFCQGSYRIVRNYFRGGRRIIARGLTRDEAVAHCRDKETSASTCTASAGKARTRRLGPWFDGFERE